MLSEEKIKLMTSLAMFEKNEGKIIFPINCYFKRDYVGSRMFRSFFCYTLSFILGLVLWVLYSVDNWINTMNTGSLIHTGIQVGVIYAVGLLIYLIISYLVLVKRYDQSARGMKVYLAKLKRLDKRYEGSAKPSTRAKGGRNQ